MTPHPPRGPARRFARRLVGNLGAGARIVLFLGARAGAFRFDVPQLVGLFAAGVSVSIATSWPTVAEPLAFSAAGLYGHALSLLVLCAVGLSARPASFVPLLGGLLAIQPALILVFNAIWLGLHALVDPEEGATYAAAWGIAGSVMIGWWFVSTIQVVVLFGGLRSGRAAVGVVVLLVGAALFEAVAPSRPWWETDWAAYAEEETIESEPTVDGEAVFYAQPDLLAQATASLSAQRPGVVDLYFVGFGADASQSVFLREVRHARDLFDRRFDTGGRSVSLVNHRDTVEDLPLASATNLERALLEIGARMDRDEDVLFLFLTGHGSSDHELSVRFSPLPLNGIRPERIAAAIDAAGIRHRVVVVSACYSGGFVDALADDDSLVMTAAAADRRSFGCSEEAEFTYFGRAYFGEALEETLSFEHAFALARDVITAREEAEGQTPSLPQIHVGGGIAERLARVEARLGRRSAVARAHDAPNGEL